MAIDTGKSSGEEEYRPADYDSSVFEAASNADAIPNSSEGAGTYKDNKAANLLEHLQRKNIIIVVIVLIGIFCAYKIVDVLFSTGSKHHKVGSQLHAQMPKPMVKPAQPALAANAATNHSQPPVAVAAVVDRINSIEQHVNSGQTEMVRLSNQVNDMQTAMSNIDTKLSTLTSSVQAVADIIAKQEAIQAAARQAKRKIIQSAPKPIYYVKAMVPGRAWLETKNGETLTISVGNNLQGYGRVEVIDPNQGTLITSSGAIIGYSPGDN